jgi:hypothetical protein
LAADALVPPLMRLLTSWISPSESRPKPPPEADGRMILVVRVAPAKASRPLLIHGAAPIRLHGRKSVADRAGARTTDQ